MKRFERRASEALVLAELLDRTVTLRDTGQQVTIVDAAMEQNRNRDWVITRLASAPTAPRLPRRRGHLPGRVGRGGRARRPRAEPGHRRAAVDAVRPARGRRRERPAGHARQAPQEVVAALDDERLADVLQELPEDDQVELLHTLGDERAADVLEAMDDDDAADLLGEMSAADQQRLLELMEPEEAEPVRRLMTYGDYTAGGMMTSEPVILLPDATVAEALALVRNPELSPALAAQVFVVRPPQATPTGKFLGTAHLQRLLREPPSALVSGICENDTGALRPTPRSRRSPGTWRPTTSSRRRSSTTTTGCSARCPSTTCSTTCCPRAGATPTGRERRPWLSRARGSTSRKIERRGPRLTLRRRGLRPADRADRALPRHRPVPGRADRGRHRLGAVEHPRADRRCSFDPYPTRSSS